MSSIRVHHTATIDKAWDGSKNEARLREGGSASYYRKAFAWQDPEAEPVNKSGYRFIHHEVEAGGKVGAANLRAVSSGIGVLHGGRRGTTIPQKDRAGVYRHLAAHLRDAGKEPPELEK
jgi:Escherichia/Staphylococcus phage prohead protease